MSVLGRLAAVLSLSGAVAAAVCACSARNSADATPGDAGPDARDSGFLRFGECASACEVRIRPRLVVGLYPDDARAASVRVSARETDGTLVALDRASGCGDLPVSSCSFTFYTLPRDVKVQLVLEDGAEPPLPFEVTVGPFNYCSRDMTYVPLHRADAGAGWTMGATRYVSPCDAL